MTEINVVDAPCGKGKTSWAIQYMNENPDRNFIFITPFLDEVKRIKLNCEDFKEPTDTKGSKMASLKTLLDNQHNIVSTHSLFSMADDEVLELLRLGKYTLVLDEVMDVVRRETISGHDIKLLIDGGWIRIDEKTCQVIALDHFEPYQGKFHDIIDKARANRLIYFNKTFMVWEFSPEFFKVMQEVYVLTYLFRGQIQRCYFDFHQIPYNMRSVAGEHDRGYHLIPYDPGTVDLEFRQFAKVNINIYEGPLNDIGGYRPGLFLVSKAQQTQRHDIAETPKEHVQLFPQYPKGPCQGQHVDLL